MLEVPWTLALAGSASGAVMAVLELIDRPRNEKERCSRSGTREQRKRES